MSEAAWGEPVGRDVYLRQTTFSTNDDAKRAAREGAPAGLALVARLQEGGRGRRGAAWAGLEGDLLMSVVLRPCVPMALLGGLPAVCALGVLDALRDDLGCADVALKWPNDLVCTAGAKLGGILVEAGAAGAGVFAACGVGINLADGPRDQAAFLTGALPAASLASARPSRQTPPLGELASLVRDRICARVAAWQASVAAGGAQTGPLAPVLGEYCDALAALGRQVAVVSPEGVPMGEGVFAGIDAWGRATVRLADGREVDFAPEQASLRDVTALGTFGGM